MSKDERKEFVDPEMDVRAYGFIATRISVYVRHGLC